MLKDLSHDMQSLLVKHVRASFSLLLPFLICMHYTEDIFEKWLEQLFQVLLALCHMLIVLVVDILDNVEV